jgi:23S rRNA (adenine1618-N6)-methyltransferase
MKEAQTGTLRKLSNLKHRKVTRVNLNFGGHKNELYCAGGERRFIHNMVIQSKLFSTSCFWFSTLVSKQSNLKSIYRALENINVTELKTVPMGQGNKTSRFVAWTFLNKEQRSKWINTRWNKK